MEDMTTVNGYLKQPNGDGIEGITVVAQISGSGPPYYFSGNYLIGVSSSETCTDSDGKWTLELCPNTYIKPSGTDYTFTFKYEPPYNAVFYSEKYQDMESIVYTGITVPEEVDDEPVEFFDLIDEDD